MTKTQTVPASTLRVGDVICFGMTNATRKVNEIVERPDGWLIIRGRGWSTVQAPDASIRIPVRR